MTQLYDRHGRIDLCSRLRFILSFTQGPSTFCLLNHRLAVTIPVQRVVHHSLLTCHISLAYALHNTKLARIVCMRCRLAPLNVYIVHICTRPSLTLHIHLIYFSLHNMRLQQSCFAFTSSYFLVSGLIVSDCCSSLGVQAAFKPVRALRQMLMKGKTPVAEKK